MLDSTVNCPGVETTMFLIMIYGSHTSHAINLSVHYPKYFVKNLYTKVTQHIIFMYIMLAIHVRIGKLWYNLANIHS